MENAGIIQAIRNKIEQRKKSLRAGICNEEVFTKKQRNEMLVASEELDRLNRFLSTLESEKPNQDELEKEIERCIIEPYYDLDGVAVKGATAYITVNDVADIARHFAEWGAEHAREQMMKDAVPFYEILKVVPPGPERDRVLLIVVKEGRL